jgi:outer membrane protein insertion porin family
LSITVDEGPQYILTDYKLSGELILAQEEIVKHIEVDTHQPFSREQVTQAQQQIAKLYAEHGYAFAQVNIRPTIDDKQQTIAIDFHIIPGRLIYVRQINFFGNTKTEDRTLRRAMHQMESSVVNMAHINESIRRLNLLGYVKDVKYELKPVSSTNNQVDLDVSVTETPAATITAGIGYSTAKGILGQMSFTQPNFLGSGKFLSLNVEVSELDEVYSARYFDPYYTLDGVSVGVSGYMSRFKPGKLQSVTGAYRREMYGVDLDIGLPLNNYNSLGFAAGYQHTNIRVFDNPPSFIRDFLTQHGQRFDLVKFTGSWVFDSRDRALFPTEGMRSSLSAMVTVPVFNETLRYYKTNYDLRAYVPLDEARQWIVLAGGGVGYGDGYGSTTALPFFENYFGGGVGAPIPIAGFRPYSLGPEDEFGGAIGGNFGYYARAGLIVPQFSEITRTTLFVDAANLHNSDLQPANNINQVRISAGAALEIRTIIGNIGFALAKPVKKFASDDELIFDFFIGTTL